jgi:hypothetical protein
MARLINLLAQKIKPRLTFSEYFLGRFPDQTLNNDIEIRQ